MAKNSECSLIRIRRSDIYIVKTLQAEATLTIRKPVRTIDLITMLIHHGGKAMRKDKFSQLENMAYRQSFYRPRLADNDK